MSTKTTSQRFTRGMIARMSPDVRLGEHSVSVQRDLKAPMADGTILLGDLYLPDTVAPGTPTIVMRSPYGRRGAMSLRDTWPLASLGFPVFVQSCRGTFGSGGTFSPQLDEQRDGIDTLRWVRQQQWFTGRLVTAGPSYLGYAQWAVAGHLQKHEPETAPDALALFVTMPDFGAITWDHGAYSLRNALGWTKFRSTMERPGAMLAMLLPDRKLERAFRSIPLADGDTVALGGHKDWYQDWVRHEHLTDDYWVQQSHTHTVKDVTAPVTMVSGWYDIFAPWQHADYATLVAHGNPPRFTIGPWGHSTPGQVAETVNGTVDFLREKFLGEPGTREKPVRIFLTGAEQWHDLESWPPPSTSDVAWNLGAGGTLAPTTLPGDPTTYVYDPNDPTPTIGGPQIQGDSGPVDNTAHEARSDVITFTSDALASDTDVTGIPHAVVWVSSDRPSLDLFVRLCDVGPDGRSMTVCDGIRRIGTPATAATDPAPDGDGVREVDVPLWPTGHRFLAGHSIRVQVSSGSFPRYARNSGTGALAADDTELLVATQAIHHGPKHPSRILLPTWAH